MPPATAAAVAVAPAGAVVSRITAMVRKNMDYSMRHVAIVGQCRDKAQTVRDLTSALNIPKPSVSRGIDAMVEAKMVVRRADPSDRRSVLVEITATGRKFLVDIER